MNPHELEYESHPLMQHLDKAARHTCYPCKIKLEASRYLPYIDSALGLLILTHAWLTAFLIYLKAKIDYGSYESALIPVLMVPIELCVTSLAVIAVIYKDFVRLKVRGITVWQRQALGRLIRNILVFSLCILGLLIIIQGLSKLESLQSMLCPFLILGFLGLVKFIMIETEDTWFWVSCTVCAELEMLAAIYKFDYDGPIELKGMLCLSVVFTSIVLMYSMVLTRRFILRYELYNAVQSLCGFFASILILLIEVLLVLHSKLFNMHYQLIFICTLLSCILYTISLSRPLGILIKDILTGHIEEGSLDIRSSSRFLYNRPHSV